MFAWEIGLLSSGFLTLNFTFGAASRTSRFKEAAGSAFPSFKAIPEPPAVAVNVSDLFNATLGIPYGVASILYMPAASITKSKLVPDPELARYSK